MKILIVGDSVGSLTAVRELGAAGWRVGVGSPSRFDLIALSRWTVKWHRVPSPFGDLEDFITAINDAVEKYHYEILLGAGDAEVLALSAIRSRLVARVPYTSHENVVRGFDKLDFPAVARNAGLSTPLTRPAIAATLESMALPVVVKARLNWTPDSSHERVKVAISWNHEAAMEHAARMRSTGAEPFFQELVSGTVLHFVTLCNEDSKIISRVVHVTTLLGASDSGQSARARVVEADSELERKIQTFLGEIQWFGLVDLQFWIPDDGEPMLTDFNGRIYGGLVLPHAAGMRAVDTWARLATGREIVAPLPIKIGARYQALEGDLRRALSLAGIKRITGVIDCVAHSFSSCHPILCWSDPLPTVGYLGRLAARLVRKTARRGEAN